MNCKQYISNIFGQKFSVHTNEGFLPSLPGSPKNKEYFIDHWQALQFIHRLDVSIEYWRRLDHCIGLSRHDGSRTEIENAIATAILHGRIQFQRIDESNINADKHTITAKNNNTYTIVTAESLTLFEQRHIVPFLSINNAESFLKSSDISISQQCQLLQLNNISEKKSSNLLQLVAQQMYEKALFVVARKPSVPKSKQENHLHDNVNQPGNRQPELAPPTAPWIEFILKDEDSGEPLNNIKVKLRLPDGSVVIKISDKNGSIYLNNLNEGDCSIEDIIDNDGWEFRSLERTH